MVGRLVVRGISPAFVAMLASAAFAVSDHSITEFPRIAGETDDAPRFQRAVDACYGGGLLTVPGGNYTIARTVFVTNLCSIEMSPGARIKAVAEIDWMFKINQMWQYNSKTAPKDVEANIYNLTFRGGTLDADGKASCLAVDNYRHFTLENATFLNGRVYGVGIETEGLGYEMTANNLYFKTLIPGLAGNTALFTKGGDSQYTDIIVVDYTVGIRVLYGGANRFTRCHVWGGPIGFTGKKDGELPEMLRRSVCFKSNGTGTIFRDCYADTGEIGYWIKGGDAQLFGCYYFNNTGFGLKDVAVIRQDGGQLRCDGNNFLGQTPETKLYVGSPNAKVYWGPNNVFKGFKASSLPRVTSATCQAETVSPPVSIDVGRQLMLDDELFATNTMKRVWHRPARQPQPVAMQSLAGGVWYDGAAHRYVGWTDDGATRMVSQDGIRWAAEKGGEWLGYDRVRVTMDCDALDGKPFKAFAVKHDVGFVAASADGISWGEPVRALAGGDLAMAFYNPFTCQWGYSLRNTVKKGGAMAQDYHEADNFFFGARVRPPRRGGRGTPVPTPWVRESKKLRGKSYRDIGEFACIPYEGVLIGMAQVFDGEEKKGSDLWFGFARNRWHWTFPKPSEGEAFISQTRRNGDRDAHALVPNPGVCVVAGDELRFYYSAANKATGYATLRRDGFCSVQDGEIRTKPLMFAKGDRLWVNADTRQGELTVRVVGQDGKNFGERKISGKNATRLEVGAVDANNPFSLVFISRGGAKLYSFWTGGADGRSGGYLAGGSPESATLRDEVNVR